MIPGWNLLIQFWKAHGDPNNFPLVAEGPHLPLIVIAILYFSCKMLIPDIIKRRGRPFDTRPLEIVFHGFFFGVFGVSFCIGIYVFKGFFVFMKCSPIILPTVLVPLRSYFVIIGIIAFHIYSMHFIFSAANGRRLNEVHLFYHAISLFFSTYGANVQPNENVCMYVLLEGFYLIGFSMLQVINSASIEVKSKMTRFRTKVYLGCVRFRQYQYIVLIVHAILHLIQDCAMKKELAFIQLIVVIVFKQLFKRELKTLNDLPYCNDSYLKEQINEKEFKEKETKVN